MNIAAMEANNALESLDADNPEVGIITRSLDEMEETISELEDKIFDLKHEKLQLGRELAAAYELLEKSGALHPNNFDFKGIQWALLKLEERKLGGGL